MTGSTPAPQPEPADADALFAAVYDRLKAMAGRARAREHAATLDTTAIVHELYLRIGAREELRFQHPAQFFAYAARAMRHLLRDRARDRMRWRAGGDWQRVTLTDGDDRLALDSAAEALELERSLESLEAADPRAARVVELRYFAGLTHEAIADAIGVTRRTVDRDWRFARAYLAAELE